MKFLNPIYRYFFAFGVAHIIFNRALVYPILDMVEPAYQPFAGNILTAISVLLMVTSIVLFVPTVISSIKNKHTGVYVYGLILVTYTIFWLYITIYDTFFLFNTPYARCMQEFNDIARCEDL